MTYRNTFAADRVLGSLPRGAQPKIEILNQRIEPHNFDQGKKVLPTYPPPRQSIASLLIGQSAAFVGGGLARFATNSAENSVLAIGYAETSNFFRMASPTLRTTAKAHGSKGTRN